jgi:uncharacterized protein (DUF362 family)
MSLVSFVKTKRSDIKRAIKNSLDLLGYKFEKNIQEVIIKPNMCYYWDYSTGQTTDPKFVVAMIEVLREKISPHVNISIVESDASAMKCKYVFKFLGYQKIAKQYGVKLVNLSKVETEPAKVEIKDQIFNLVIPKIIKNADLRINIPKIKYLELTKISCALKNIFGCNPYPKKFEYHTKLDEAIVALNKILKFDLCIVDGVIVSGIHPQKLGLIMASPDPVAIDVVASKIAGINPKSVKYIMLAASEGIGSPYFIPKGTDLHYFERKYPKKKAAHKIVRLGYKLIQLLGLENRLG